MLAIVREENERNGKTMATIQQFFPTYANKSTFEQKMMDILFAIPVGQEFSDMDFPRMTGDFSRAISNGLHLKVLTTATESSYQGESRPDGCKLYQTPDDKYVWKK